MGFLIDMIGSFLVLAFLILTIATVNVNMNQDLYESTFELNAQWSLIELARTIEYDFLKVGYHAVKPAIVLADSDRIAFKADLTNSGSIDSVSYFLGPATEGGVTSTPNPRDRVLYRLENGQAQRGANLGVVDFRLTYYDSSGAVTIDRTLIRSIRVQLTVESPYPIDMKYPGVYWEKLIYPRNL